MDHTSGPQAGQFLCTEVQKSCTNDDIVLLCELVQFLRAWWEVFQSSIQQVDRVASAKANDALVEAVALARRIARQLGVVLPDFLNVDWSASVPPAGHAVITEI